MSDEIKIGKGVFQEIRDLGNVVSFDGKPLSQKECRTRFKELSRKDKTTKPILKSIFFKLYGEKL